VSCAGSCAVRRAVRCHVVMLMELLKMSLQTGVAVVRVGLFVPRVGLGCICPEWGAKICSCLGRGMGMSCHYHKEVA